MALGIELTPVSATAQSHPENAFSNPPIQTDRPTFSASAALVPARSFQVELGYKRTRGDDETKIEWGQLLLRYGLSSNIELRVAPNSYNVARRMGTEDEGIEDSRISAKFSLVREANGAIPATSLLPGLLLDTGSSSIGNGQSLPSLTLLLDWRLPGSWSLTSNLGWERARSNDQEFDKLSASLSVSYPLTKRLTGYAEVYVFDRESLDGDTASYYDLDLVYLVAHTLSIDATVGSGLSGTDTDYFFGLGLSKRW